MGHSIYKISLTLLAVYLAYVALCFVLQRHIIFPGQYMQAPGGGSRGVAGLQRLWLTISEGRVETWFIPPSGFDRNPQPAPVVIFTHGNAEHIDIWPGMLSGYSEMGVSLLLVEFPGYGRSEGSPSQETITETMLAAYDMLVSRQDVDPERIVVHGRSVGSGAACALLGKRKVAAVILESSFTGIRSFARARLLPPFLVLDPFDNLAAIERYEGPVLVIHGKLDDIIPYRHGKQLARAARNGRLVTYDCAHNDCPPDRDRMWRDVTDFFVENGILGRSGS